MNDQPDLQPEEARSLMSALLDGELGAEDAERLNSYLENNPREIDWMESHLIVSESIRGQSAPPQQKDSINKILNTLPPRKQPRSNLLSFPRRFIPMATAAAAAFVAILGWQVTQKSPVAPATIGSDVEFVSTDIPNANPVVYTDEEIGWTVVWVETMDPIPDDEA
ncbi:hypothetical protein MLD52_19920 [Puniceicoccaceae bacterium K14]|nr:hypothetical protein [Puniceicoccaceae bacterium K14]